ncbi:MAG: hypothetical protein OIN66_15140 [Candidatus Methanoperedens sp.]|nr:hypothetical protein [Candidatus Methanoperedens sp.]
MIGVSNTSRLKETYREYGSPALMGGLWGLATLDQFFINVWDHFQPNWLVKLITLPGFISHQIPYYLLSFEPLSGLLSIFVPLVIGAGIGVLIHWINNNLIPAEIKRNELKDISISKKIIAIYALSYLTIGYIVVFVIYLLSNPGYLQPCPPELAPFKCTGVAGLIRNLSIRSDFWLQVAIWPFTLFAYLTGRD